MPENSVTENTTHTPGPWTVDFDRFDQAHAITGLYGSLVATVPVAKFGLSTANSISERKHRAVDARLIAAVPELLATAKQVYEDFDKQIYGGRAVDCLKHWQALEAAIAKAEGRS